MKPVFSSPAITAVRVTACEILADLPEADGTIAWDSTKLVCVHVQAGDTVGMGYT